MNGSHSDSFGEAIIGTGERLLIPIRDSHETVEVSLDNLPDESADISDILKLELAPLELWRECAVEYYKRGKYQQFEAILKEASGPQAQMAYKGKQHDHGRIAIINTLAAYYTQKGRTERDPIAAQRYFGDATEQFNNANAIDFQVSMTRVGEGLLLLAKHEMTSAENYFDLAINADQVKQENIPAVLGKACTTYHRKDYLAAAMLYRKALTMNPALPAYARVGLGLCYFKLQDYTMSRASFERVLELDSENVHALIGLAILELNSDEKDKNQKAMEIIHRAYRIEPTNPVVLNLLANHYFYTQDYDKVHSLARKAVEHSESPQIKAECFYQLARSYHIQGDYDRAFHFYQQAKSFDNQHVMVLLGFGQMCIYKNDLPKAIEAFEHVYKLHPKNYDVQRILGSLYGTTGKLIRAHELLYAASQQEPNDVELLVELGQVSERVDAQKAYAAHHRLLKILTRQNRSVPSELLNNLGVVCMKLNLFLEAKEHLTKSLRHGQAVETILETKQIHAENVTTIFNLALLAESQSQYDHATLLHICINTSFKTYIDSYLRRAILAKKSGKEDEATALVTEALTLNPNNIDAITLRGNLHLASHAWTPAAKPFQQIIDKLDKNDAYAKLALGNIHYQLAKDRARNPKSDPRKIADLYHKSGLYYRSVLSKDPQNMYAANGLAVVVAQQGHLTDAKEMFSAVKESTRDELLDVWLNTAHIYVTQGQYISAIKMYQHVLDKNDHIDVQVMLYLARAYYNYGQMQDCKRVLLKAIHIEPHNPVLWYNLALAQEDYAIQILQTSKLERTLEQVELACSELEQAHRIFTRLSAGETPVPHFPQIPSKSKSHAAFCEKSRTDAEPHLSHARQRDAEARDIAEKSVAVQRALEEKQREEQEKAEAEASAERERLEQMALQKKKHLEEISTSWVTVTSKEAKKEDDADYAPHKHEPEERSEKKKKKKKRSSDDDDDGPARKKKKDKKEKKDKSKSKLSTTAMAADADVGEATDDTPVATSTTDDGEAESWQRLREERAAKARGGASAPAKRRLHKAAADDDEEEMQIDEDQEMTETAGGDEPSADAEAPAEEEVGDAEDDDEDQIGRKRKNRRGGVAEDEDEEHAEEQPAEAEEEQPVEEEAEAAAAAAEEEQPTEEAATEETQEPEEATAETVEETAATEETPGGEDIEMAEDAPTEETPAE